MKKLSANIPSALAALGREIPDARKKARASQVRGMWKDAVEDIYKDGAPLFLEHTNSVYLMDKDNVRTLVVYVDESIFAAELNAQRELFKLKFLDRFGEAVEVFDIHISRGSYKTQHPYRDENASVQQEIDKRPPKPLSTAQLEEVNAQVSLVENPTVREALLKAMITDMEWKKGQFDKNNT